MQEFKNNLQNKKLGFLIFISESLLKSLKYEKRKLDNSKNEIII